MEDMIERRGMMEIPGLYKLIFVETNFINFEIEKGCNENKTKVVFYSNGPTLRMMITGELYQLWGPWANIATFLANICI
jgi:hypothetical protein